MSDASLRSAIVVMGVSGSGKTSVGRALAARLGLDFADGDDLHSPANVAKMHAGIALSEADRAPWLDAVGAVLADAVAHSAGVVVACSALKRAYRDRLRTAAPGCRFVHLALPQAEARQRVTGRPGHFMPADLVVDQFAILEPAQPDETDMSTIDATPGFERVVAAAYRALATPS